MEAVPGATAVKVGDEPVPGSRRSEDPSEVITHGRPPLEPRSTSRRSPVLTHTAAPLSAAVSRTTCAEPLCVGTGVRHPVGPGGGIVEAVRAEWVGAGPVAPTAPDDVPPPQPAAAAVSATATDVVKARVNTFPGTRTGRARFRATGVPSDDVDATMVTVNADVSADADDAQPLPELVRPMLAVPGGLPSPQEDVHWRYEFKWDGVRAVAYVQDGRVHLMSRNDLDVSRSYPEVLALPEALQRGIAGIFDGELVTFDAAGRPSFGRLQERMHVADADVARRLAERTPVVYMVFDVLHLHGASTLRTPYVERRRLLEGLHIETASWRVPPSLPGPGADVLAASAEGHLEGVVAKRVASVYRPGARSPDWRKVKLFRTQEVVIGGWRPGHGRREGMIGSLLLGVPGSTGLQFAGGVGTGFTERMLRELADELRPLAQHRSPFAGELPRAETRDARWVAPDLVGEVVFSEWTSDGRLRQPSWRGLRPDKRPQEVVRES